jgi:hypothetical protein
MKGQVMQKTKYFVLTAALVLLGTFAAKPVFAADSPLSQGQAAGVFIGKNFQSLSGTITVSDSGAVDNGVLTLANNLQDTTNNTTVLAGTYTWGGNGGSVAGQLTVATSTGTEVLPLVIQASSSSTSIGASFLAGNLSLDNVPLLNFGTHDAGDVLNGVFATTGIGASQELDATTSQPIDSFAQVTDLRGTDAGWTLSVMEEGQFINSLTGQKLSGSAITFSGISIANSSGSPIADLTQAANSIPLPRSVPTMIFGASASTGNNTVNGGTANPDATSNDGIGTGINTITFGKLANDTVDAPVGTTYLGDTNPASPGTQVINPAIRLTIPQGTVVAASGTYETTLVWTLQDSAPTPQ